MTCILVSGFLVQQLSLLHLIVDVGHNNNALKELNDCIGGLLHLGPNVITFRTLLHLGQLLHLGLQHALPHSLADSSSFSDSLPVALDIQWWRASH